jgi:hypothetical protein
MDASPQPVKVRASKIEFDQSKTGCASTKRSAAIGNFQLMILHFQCHRWLPQARAEATSGNSLPAMASKLDVGGHHTR